MRRSVLLFLSLFVFLQLPAQTPLSGVINQYTSAISYDSCLSILTVADASSFNVGEQVLVIQMQGATIDESNSASFGNITNLGSAGLFEKALITEITDNNISFDKRLLHQYDYAGSVQVVSFPRFDNATITGELTGQAWDGTTGGVIALEVNGLLTMNAGINANGLGFRGGAVNILSSNCQWFLNEDNYFYDASNWRGAAKGEGIAPIIVGKEAGRGAQANGGGGGNDHNSGGGGGSNVVTGGLGGEQTPSSTFQCQGEFPGRGGEALSASAQRMFLGGGGGAGHADNTGAGSPGGHGGGIVILIANDLDGQDNIITANGADAPFAPGDGGGGGGGAGSVLIEAPNVFSLYFVEAKGGSGGSTQNFTDRCFGPGGGGSGGHLLLNTIFFPITDLSGGIAGENTVASSACNSLNNGAADGQPGVQTLFSDFPAGTISADKISILDQPVSTTIACTNEALNLSITATGSNLEYQWQVDSGNGFENIANGGLYNGAQSANLTIDPIDGSLAGYQFQCLLQNDCFNEQSSSTTLSIESAPIVDFTSQLLSGTTMQFENLTQFGASFVWDFGDGTGNQSMAENPSYTFPSDGTYLVTLQVQNNCGLDAITQEVVITSAPSANFTTDLQTGCAPLQVLYTSLASNNSDSLAWSFPGGTPVMASTNTVLVTYETPGTYGASLIAINAAGADTLVMSEEIIVEGPPQADFSVIIDELTIVFQNNTVGGVSYQWDFGDQNTSSQEAPTYTYQDNGIYEVSLIASNDCGQDTSVQTVTTGIVPEANFIAESTGGCAPVSINFIDLSQGLVTSRVWSFSGGDPSTSTDSTVLVTYETPGVYDVSLIAINATAADTVISTAFIEVFDQPVAGFTFEQDGPTISFTNTSTGSGLTFAWDFGDNSPVSNEENPVYTYTENGTYEIVLTVSNPFCSGLVSNFIEIDVNSTEIAPLKEQIQLAPNPTNGNLWVQLPSQLVPEIQTLRLTNLKGQRLGNWKVQEARTVLDLMDLPTGLYYLEVLTKEQVLHYPVIRQ